VAQNHLKSVRKLRYIVGPGNTADGGGGWNRRRWLQGQRMPMVFGVESRSVTVGRPKTSGGLSQRRYPHAEQYFRADYNGHEYADMPWSKDHLSSPFQGICLALIWSGFHRCLRFNEWLLDLDCRSIRADGLPRILGFSSVVPYWYWKSLP
jgi:hypothetical protein